ncbi:hypothetical protein KEJ34_08540 [Candidatus Bathyarchaeota archaeon]|nr:hypothetical protein [Candidatus Bathyarchaeota archaeon]
MVSGGLLVLCCLLRPRADDGRTINGILYVLVSTLAPVSESDKGLNLVKCFIYLHDALFINHLKPIPHHYS